MSTHALIAITAAVVATLVLATIYSVGRPKPAPQKLACPLQTEERAKHPGMVWIPAGTFEMGDDVYPEEQPPRETSVDGFWMDRTEVTNAEFAEFVRATNHVTVAERTHGAAVFVMPSGADNLSDASKWWRYVEGASWRHPGGPGTSIEGREHFPVVALAYEDVEAYAKWKGRALPSEAQWEWAARAGKPRADNEREQPKDANTWQGVFPIIDSGDDGFVGLAPVGCFSANAFGLSDMIGNVWEWTADDSPNHDAKSRVIKGGSYLCAPNYCLRYRAGARQAQEEALGTSHLGFRTILAAPGP